MRFLMNNPNFTNNIVLNNPYLNTIKNMTIDEDLEKKWKAYLATKKRNFIIGTTHKMTRTEYVIGLIDNPYRQFAKNREALTKQMTDKIELLPALHQYSLMGMVFYHFRQSIAENSEEDISPMPLHAFKAKIADNFRFNLDKWEL